MAKLSLTDLASLSNETSVITAINNNNQATEVALENTLSRDGTSPNEMEADLDMNNNRIINLPDAIDDSEPVTKAQLDAVVLASGGGEGVTDHGLLTGLDHDDHTQYLNNARGDARYQPLDSDLTAIAALTTTSYGRAFLTLADAAAARSALSLGTMATETASNYLTTASASSSYQPLDSDLTAIAALTTTSFGRSLLSQADASAARTTLGLAIGTDVQAYDADLAAIAGLTSAANKVPYFTGSGTAAVADLSSFGRTLIDDADAATARGTVGLATSTTAGRLARYTDTTGATGQTSGLYEDGSGNVGIGTTNPGYKLEVVTESSAGPFYLTKYDGLTLNNGMIGRAARGSASAPTATQAGDRGMFVIGASYGGSTWANHAAMSFYAAETQSETARGSYITFETTPLGATSRSERARIFPNGNVSIGTTTDLNPLAVNQASNTTAATVETYGFSLALSGGRAITLGVDGTYAYMQSWGGKPLYLNSQGNDLLFGAGRFGLGLTAPGYQLELSTDSAGKPSTTTWTVTSDERLKENIIAADLERCWDIVAGIPLKRYTWRGDVYTTDAVKDRSKLGWIAQEVQPFFARAVDTYKFQKVPVDDGVEEYQEQETVLETITENVVEVIDGRAIMTTRERQQTMLAYDELPVVDTNGNAVLNDNGEQMTYRAPKMTTKTRQKKRTETIDDCLSLNADQIYAAMYGALQLAMKRIEALEAQISKV
jgi:hypothetical protein